ncbi:MAG: O-antigen polymerase, partial [Pseudohongiellaceae bacterium]
YCWLCAVVTGLVIAWWLPYAGGIQSSEKELISIESARSIHYPQTLEMIKERPVAGYGYGRFEKAYLNFTAQKFAAGESDEPGFAPLDHPHNELIFWWVEGGIIAIIGLLAAAWLVGKRLFKLQLWHSLAIVSIFFPIVLHTQLEYPFYVSAQHFIIFIIYIFYLDSLSAHAINKDVSYVLLPGVLALVIPIMTTIFMSTAIQSSLLLSRFEMGINPDIRALEKIKNPLVISERLNWAIRSRLVVNGIINGNDEQILSFISWAPSLIDNKPRQIFYSYLILAYYGVEDMDNMKRIQDEANFLFPKSDFAIENIISQLVSVMPAPAISGQNISP